MIFDPRYSVRSLDLISEDAQEAQMWVQALNHIIEASKSVELQREHENYLHSQFLAADKNKDGNLLLQEFAELLKQLNIEMTADDIIDVFDEVNTDHTAINGQQVIDEKEFLAFYNNLLEREVLHAIFKQVIPLLWHCVEITEFYCHVILPRISWNQLFH